MPHPVRLFTIATRIAVLPLYTITIFTSAALLFLVQPMFAKLVLPLLGGSPAVWNIAMVFYQAVLLAGYAYAHAATSRLGPRRLAPWHLALMLAPFAVLPLHIPATWTPPVSANPLPWLLALLAVAVGLPFFVISTMSPLLQKWFAATGHPQGRDPYFLYAASNVGSLLALFAYPLLVEPLWTLEEQMRLWTVGYAVLVALALACALGLRRNGSIPAPTDASAPIVTAADASGPITARRRARWVFLAFVPSSLMLGVTTYLSTDIAAVPLLWVLPLSLYLVTFILAFGRRSLPRAGWARALPILMVGLVMIFMLRATQPAVLIVVLHLAVFFVAALICHGELGRNHPVAANLTGFYFWLSLGGVLGGVFNALVAPLLFRSVVEYPVALVLAAFVGLRPAQPDASRRARVLDVTGPILLGALTAVLITFGRIPPPVFFGLATVGCYCFSTRPLRFGLGLAALFLVAPLHYGEHGRPLCVKRSFFGVHRVTLAPEGRHHLLVHGKIIHGMQHLDPVRRAEPLTYYHRTGPIGQVFAACNTNASAAVGVVGLGAGSLASYGLPGQPWTFFEIDPVVEQLARNTNYFTFLSASPARVRVVLGDARRSLAAVPDGAFHLLVLDAYSADAIPIHLLTREALALYLRKLAPGGVLAFHISNQHFNLEPVLAVLVRDARATCLVQDDDTVATADHAEGKRESTWALLARRPLELAEFTRSARWRPAAEQPGVSLWTDSYSSVLKVFNWH